MKSVLKQGGSLLAAGALMSVGLVAVAPSPASAVTPALHDPEVEVDTQGYHGGGACSEDAGATTGGDPDTATPADGNASVSSSISYGVDGPDGDALADATYTASGTVTSKVTVDADDVFSLLELRLTAEANADAGSTGCGGYASVDGDLDVGVYLPRPGSLALVLEGTPKGTYARAGFDRYADADYTEWLGFVELDAEGLGAEAGPSRVPAGYYELHLDLDAWAAADPEAYEVSSFSGSLKGSISYEPDPAPGDAVAKASGKAKKYVKFPAEVDCSTHKATAKFKKKAKKVKKDTKKVIFKAGSKTVKKLKGKKIKPGKKVTLKKIPPSAKKLKVIFKLKGGKKLKGNRKYQPC